jgi:hypothetical protein
MNRPLPDDELDQALAQFGASVRDWAGRRTVVPGPVHTWKTSGRRGMQLRWVLAAAALAIAVMIPAYSQLERHRAAEQARADAALLEQIDSAVSRAVPQPMEPLVQLVSWGADPATQTHKDSR